METKGFFGIQIQKINNHEKLEDKQYLGNCYK